ncbi:hypothetical protein C8R44DRAFT_880972 [Mycena epipterygia]|nr:hypothetical protein C8R44DRAFT_880972 [Mycena epipterygia]
MSALHALLPTPSYLPPPRAPRSLTSCFHTYSIDYSLPSSLRLHLPAPACSVFIAFLQLHLLVVVSTPPASPLPLLVVSRSSMLTRPSQKRKSTRTSPSSMAVRRGRSRHTYDLKPEMSVQAVADKVASAVKRKEYDRHVQICAARYGHTIASFGHHLTLHIGVFFCAPSAFNALLHVPLCTAPRLPTPLAPPSLPPFSTTLRFPSHSSP